MRSSPNRVVGLAFGAALLALGGLGFFANPLFGVLGVNPVQNVLHLSLGAALLLCAILGGSARCNAIVGFLLLVAGIVGLFTISTEYNVLGINGATNLLHFASAATLLAVGLGAKR